MEEEITLDYEGVSYTASYIEFDDEVVVYLQDGTQCSSTLTPGSSVRSLAMGHLRGYAITQHRKRLKEEASR